MFEFHVSVRLLEFLGVQNLIVTLIGTLSNSSKELSDSSKEIPNSSRGRKKFSEGDSSINKEERQNQKIHDFRSTTILGN